MRSVIRDSDEGMLGGLQFHERTLGLCYTIHRATNPIITARFAGRRSVGCVATFITLKPLATAVQMSQIFNPLPNHLAVLLLGSSVVCHVTPSTPP